MTPLGTPDTTGKPAPWWVMYCLSVWLLIGTMLCSAGYAPAAPEPVKPPARPFLIGYMNSETPGAMDRSWFRRLASYLNNNEDCRLFQEELNRQGYGAVELIAAEGFGDLVARLENRELDCAFCPAVAFVRQIGTRQDIVRSSYTVVFQIRRPTDVGDPPKRHGAIIVGPQHPLYRKPSDRTGRVDIDQIARHVASDQIALVSRYSAPGYLYPLHALSRSPDFSPPQRPVFRGSSEEVVKTVLSGLVSIGACEITATSETLHGTGLEPSAAELYDVILETAGAPADPVVFRDRFNPQRSKTGKLLRACLEAYFRVHRPGRLRIVASNNLAFQELKEVVEEFDKSFAREGIRP